MPPQPGPPTRREGIYTLLALLFAVIAGTSRLLPFLVALSLTILLMQPMSKAAAALTLPPVAIEVANQLCADPRPFAVMVMLSASLSFIAPFEPALLLVYGPGQYRLRDFLRAGIPVTLLSLGILLLMVPLLWPLGI